MSSSRHETNSGDQDTIGSFDLGDTEALEKELQARANRNVANNNVSVKPLDDEQEPRSHIAKRILTFLVNTVDFLLALPFSIAFNVVINPFLMAAEWMHDIRTIFQRVWEGGVHKKKKMFSGVKSVFVPDSAGDRVSALVAVVLKFIFTPVVVALSLFFSPFKGIHQAFVGSYFESNVKVKHIGPKGRAGGFVRAFQVPLANVRGHNSRSQYNIRFRSDVYKFNTTTLFAWLVVATVITAVVSAILVASGIGLPVLAAVTGFLAKAGFAFPAVMSLPVQALCVGAAVGALGTFALEVGLYVATHVLYAIGYVMQAVVEKVKSWFVKSDDMSSKLPLSQMRTIVGDNRMQGQFRVVDLNVQKTTHFWSSVFSIPSRIRSASSSRDNVDKSHDYVDLFPGD